MPAVKRSDKEKIAQVSLFKEIIPKFEQAQTPEDYDQLLKVYSQENSEFLRSREERDPFSNWQKVFENMMKEAELFFPKPSLAKEGADDQMQVVDKSAWLEPVLPTSPICRLTEHARQNPDKYQKQRNLQITLLKLSNLILANTTKDFTLNITSVFEKYLFLDDYELNLNALTVLTTILRKTPKYNFDFYLDSSLAETLFALSQGWASERPSSKDDFILLLDEKEKVDKLLLHFEYYLEAQHFPVDQDKKPIIPENAQLGKNYITIENLVHYEESADNMFIGLIEKLQLPKKYHFPLWSRIRLVKGFNQFETRKQLIHMRLMAFTIFVQHHPQPASLSALFTDSPHLITESVDLAFSTAPHISEHAKILALRALLALTQSDVDKVISVIQALGCSSHNGALPSAIRAGLLSQTKNTSQMSQAFFDELFVLVSGVILIDRGIQALKLSGIFSSLIPAISNDIDTNIKITILNVIVSFIETDESLMDLFQDLGGLDNLIKELKFRVEHAIQNGTATEESAPAARLISSIFDVVLYAAPGYVNNLVQAGIAGILAQSFKSSAKLHPSLFGLSAVVFSSLISNEPTCYAQLEKEGLIDTVLNLISEGNFPNDSRCVTQLPSLISNICLNQAGLKRITNDQGSQKIRKLFMLPVQPAYFETIRALGNHYGTNIESLLRHYPSLRPFGVIFSLDLLKRLLSHGTDAQFSSAEKQEELLNMIQNVSKFLKPLFQNTEHRKKFFEKNGLEIMLQIFTMPNLPMSYYWRLSTVFGWDTLFSTLAQGDSVKLISDTFMDLTLKTFKKFEALVPQWQNEGALKLAMEKENSVVKEMGLLTRYVHILAELSRDQRNENAMLSAGLAQSWLKDTGLTLSNALGKLQRSIIWEKSTTEYLKFQKTETERKETLRKQRTEQKKRKEEEEKSDKMEVEETDTSTKKEGKEETETSKSEKKEDDQSDKMEVEEKETSKKKEGKEEKDQESPQKRLANIEHLLARLLGFLDSLSQGLRKTLLMGVARNRVDESLRNTVDQLGNLSTNVVLEHLNFYPEGVQSINHRYVYLANAFDLTNQLLFSHNVVQTLVLHMFVNAGGIKTLYEQFNWLATQYLNSVNRFETPEEGDEDDLVLEKHDSRILYQKPLRTALQNGIELLAALAKDQNVLNSPNTPHLMTNHHITKTPFDPYVLIKEIKLQMLPILFFFMDKSIFDLPPRVIDSYLFILSSLQTSKDELIGKNPASDPQGVASTSQSSSTPAPTKKPIDEGCVTQLIEFGFSKELATRALKEVGTNDVGAAADWIFNHPEAAFTTPAPTDQQPTGDQDMDENEQLAMALAMSMGQDPETASTKPTDESTQKAEKPEEKQEKPEEKQELYPEPVVLTPSQIFEYIDEFLLPHCVSLMDKPQKQLESQQFACASLLSSCIRSKTNSAEILKTITEKVQIYAKQSPPPPQLATYLSTFEGMPLWPQDMLTNDHPIVEVVFNLLSALSKSAAPTAPENSVNQWPAFCLAILAHLTAPQYKVKETAQISPTNPPPPISSILSSSQMSTAMKLCIELLKKPLSVHCAYPLTATLSQLTRSWESAQNFILFGGVAGLLGMKTTKAPSDVPIPSPPKSHPLLNIGSILRHLMEDPATLQAAMETEITNFVNIQISQGRPVSTNNFLGQLFPVLCREPHIFMDSTTSVCRFVKGSTNLCINSKPKSKEDKEEDRSNDSTSTSTNTHTSSSTSTNASSSTSTNTSSSTSLNASSSTSTKASSSTSTQSTPAKSKQIALKKILIHLIQMLAERRQEPSTVPDADAPSLFVPSSALLDFLTLYADSYPNAATVIIRHKFKDESSKKEEKRIKRSDSKKEEKKEKKKAEPGIVSFVLNDLLDETRTWGPNDKAPTTASVGKFLTAISSRPEGKRAVFGEIQQALSATLKQIRQKSPLTDLVKVMQKASSYIEFLSLLISAPTANNAETAKILMEVDIPNILVQYVRDLDLDHPNAHGLIRSILKPMEIILKLASEKAKKTQGQEANPSDEPQQNQAVVSPMDAFSINEMEQIIGEFQPHDDEDEDEDEQDDQPVIEEIRELVPVEDDDDDDDDNDDDDDDDEDNHDDIQVLDNDDDVELSDNDDDMEDDPDEEVDEVPSLGRFTSMLQTLLGDAPQDLILPFSELLSGRGNLPNSRGGLINFLAQSQDDAPPPDLFGLSLNPPRRAREVPNTLTNMRDPGRWCDLGIAPENSTMKQYAQSYDPILTSKLITIHEKEEEERKKKEEIEKKKREEEERIRKEEEERKKKEEEERKKKEEEERKKKEEDRIRREEEERQRREQEERQRSEPPTSEVQPSSEPQSTGTVQTQNPPQSLVNPEFLAELPPEIVSELMQQQQQTAPSQPPQSTTANNSMVADTQIDQEFLAELPPEMRQEILQDMEQRRLQEERRQTQVASEEMDNSTFLATLSQDIREEVLLTADETFLNSLSPHLQAEANTLRERVYRYNQSRMGHGGNYRGHHRVARDLQDPQRSPEDDVLQDNTGKLLVDQKLIPFLFRVCYMQQQIKPHYLKVLGMLSTYPAARKLMVDISIRILNDFVHTETVERPLQIYPSFSKLLDNLQSLPHKLEKNNSIFDPVMERARGLYGFPPPLFYSVHNTGSKPSSVVALRILTALSYLVNFGNSPRVAQLMLPTKPSTQGEILPLSSGPYADLLNLVGLSGIRTNHQTLGVVLELLINVLRIQEKHWKREKERQRKEKEEKEKKEKEEKEKKEKEEKEKKEKEEKEEKKEEKEEKKEEKEEKKEEKEEKKEDIKEGKEEKKEDIKEGKQEVKEGVKEEEKEEIPPFYPKLKKDHISNITGILTLSPSCPEKIYTATAQLMNDLTRESSNLAEILAQLIEGAKGVGKSVLSNLTRLQTELINSNTHPAVLLSSFTNSAAESNLQRILRAMLELIKDENEKGEFLNSNIKLEEVWNILETCLSHLEKKQTEISDLAPTLAPLLPVIECFFVVHAHTLSKNVTDLRTSAYNLNELSGLTSLRRSISGAHEASSHGLRRSTSGVHETTGLSALRQSASDMKQSGSLVDLRKSGSIAFIGDMSNPQFARFVKFSQQHRKLLNDLIKQNPDLLGTSFKILLKAPQLIDFENKRAYFKSKLTQSQNDDYIGEIRLRVHREQLFQESYVQLQGRRGSELKGKLNITFIGEEGIDAGGLTKEWYGGLAKEIFNPDYCLFVPSADSAFQPNKSSQINPDHLSYFSFVGRIMAKALWDGHLMECHFTRSFYKHILGQKVTLHDLEGIDPTYYKNLKYMLTTDPEDLDLTFSVPQETFGARKQIDLVENGHNILVTEQNKYEYVDLISELVMTKSVQDQIDAFKKGFYDIIPQELIKIFTPKELELLISGSPEIDIEDLKRNTDYRGYKIDSPVIQNLWKILNEYDHHHRALFIQFCTGSAKVPLEGFKALTGMNGIQKLTIFKVNDTSKLPTAHTCFNQLDLPPYNTYEELKHFLDLAIEMGSEGFGFG